LAKSIKQKLYQLLDEIKDENVLNQLMEDAVFYTSKKDTVDVLNKEQLQELDEAIKEADAGDTISWDEFKQEMREWKNK
jgi:hypothetical protein